MLKLNLLPNNCINKFFNYSLIISLIVLSPFSHAVDNESLLDINTISVVSGYQQNIDQAPAVVKVFDREDIEKYGFDSLGDAISRVPGFHVTPSSDAIDTVTTSRGITSRVLLMFDGVETATGSVTSFGNFYSIPLFDIERIEIMKGPNSAVFGADAVLGVINLVTSSSSSSKSRAGAIVGNNSTRGMYGLAIGEIANRRTSFYASLYKTNGFQPRIEIDRQSRIDQQIGTQTSLAPGKANDQKDTKEARFIYELSDELKFRLHYYGRDNLGTGVGFFQALDPDGESELSAITSSLNFKKKIGGWLIDSDLIYYNKDTFADISLLPNGALGVFPQGINHKVRVEENRTKFQLSAFTEFLNHKIRTGVAYLDSDHNNNQDLRNYTFISGVTFPVPIAQTTEFKDTPFALFDELDYSLKSAFISDEWNFSDDWILTTGLRIDDYSNIGATTNPRIALTWNQSINSTYKLLYGQAYRPPSLVNLSSNGFLEALGNRDLEPTTLRMLEFIAENKLSNTLDSKLSIFSYELVDVIGQVKSDRSTNGLEFANLDDTKKGRGFEWQIKWTPLDNFKITPSWSFTDNDDDDGLNANNRFVAENLIKLDIDYALQNNWNVFVSAQHVADRSRNDGDPRKDVADYTIVNLSIHKKALIKNLNFGLKVSNLFNKDAREPISGAIVNDYPIFKGRGLKLNFSYDF